MHPRGRLPRVLADVLGVVLSGVLDECLSGLPAAAPGLGLLMAAQWQGALLWWSFDPQAPVTEFVEQSLRRFVEAFARQPVD